MPAKPQTATQSQPGLWHRKLHANFSVHYVYIASAVTISLWYDTSSAGAEHFLHTRPARISAQLFSFFLEQIWPCFAAYKAIWLVPRCTSNMSNVMPTIPVGRIVQLFTHSNKFGVTDIVMKFGKSRPWSLCTWLDFFPTLHLPICEQVQWTVKHAYNAWTNWIGIIYVCVIYEEYVQFYIVPCLRTILKRGLRQHKPGSSTRPDCVLYLVELGQVFYHDIR